MVRPGQLACQESVVRLEFLVGQAAVVAVMGVLRQCWSHTAQGCRVPLERACPVYQESPALLVSCGWVLCQAFEYSLLWLGVPGVGKVGPMGPRVRKMQCLHAYDVA